MGTPPSYMAFHGVSDDAPAATDLRARIADLERTRAIDAARIAALETRLLTLETGR